MGQTIDQVVSSCAIHIAAPPSDRASTRASRGRRRRPPRLTKAQGAALQHVRITGTNTVVLHQNLAASALEAVRPFSIVDQPGSRSREMSLANEKSKK